MSVAAAEGKLKLRENKKAMSNKSIVFNFIFSIIAICCIIQTLKVNILSSYTSDLDGEYFHCGWDAFDAHWYYPPDTYYADWYSGNQTWSKQYQQCVSSEQNYPEDCDWYNNPQKSGELWYYCNIISFVSLGISVIGYIVIFVANKYPKLKEKYPSILQKLLFVTILFQSSIPTLSLLIAIVSWFGTNGNNFGCWQSKYIFMSFDTYDKVTYTHRQIGESMIFDIVATILVGIHLLIYINHCCAYLGFGNKQKRNRKIKHGEPMLFEHNYNNDIVAIDDIIECEYEGYNGQQIEHDVENVNHMRIESIAAMAPGSDQMNESDIAIDDVEQNKYESVKQWFFESVAVPQDYKQTYYDTFIENGFDNFVVIKYMNNQDLMDIGVDKLGHRKTILIATQNV